MDSSDTKCDLCLTSSTPEDGTCTNPFKLPQPIPLAEEYIQPSTFNQPEPLAIFDLDTREIIHVHQDTDEPLPQTSSAVATPLTSIYTPQDILIPKSDIDMMLQELDFTRNENELPLRFKLIYSKNTNRKRLNILKRQKITFFRI